MKSILLPLLLGLLPFLSYGQTPTNPFKRILQPAAMQADLEMLYECLETIHPGFYTYTSKAEMDQHFQQLHTAANDPLTEMAFYQQIGDLLSLIGDVHTDIEPSETFYDLLNQEWPLFPLSVVWLEEHLYVSHNLSSEVEIQPGDRLLRINGLSADSLYLNIRRYLPRDGYNTTSPNHVLSGKYGGFRNYYASLYGIFDTFEVVVLSTTGTERTFTIKGDRYAQLFERGNALLTQRPPKKTKQLELRIEGDLGILTVRSFHPAKIQNNGQRYSRFFAKAFQQLNKAGVTQLILDLRKNGGGHESVFMELFSYLHPKPFVAYQELSTITNTIPHKSHFLEQDEIAELEATADKRLIEKGDRYLLQGEAGTQAYPPQSPQYDGPLYVLIDGGSSSATGDFAGLLQQHQRATFIGEELGGNSRQNNAGSTFTLILPNSQIAVIIPNLRYLINNKTPNSGYGIRPDYPFSISIADYLSSEDEVLNYARQLIKE